MLKRIRNKTIHLIRLYSGLIHSFKSVVREITEVEAKDNRKYLEITDPNGDETETKVADKNKDKPDAFGADSILNDYMDRAERTVLNSLEEDKASFTDKDLWKLENYEITRSTRTKNKKQSRNNVIKKINELKSKRGE